ncbi:hypothetical protein PZA11_001856 [Diplocarpon coronariae]|uniref:NADP-dependent oxidoreductase domain-containing protein n=1 Tax=Diplocarpon coronariae TaxID=2795749 RepID=A0A218Z0V5_9HELO|nr:hypothetical protein B2J93_4682 [Marssonina coronariae]
MPRVGLGTFRLKHDAVKQPIRDAIRLGYRHIDTAAVYRNEAEIGHVLQELYGAFPGSLSRSELWITSKLSPYDLATPRDALLKTLSDLQTDYLDLYLIHWPAAARQPASSPENKKLRIAAWQALNEAKNEGLVRQIGVSNFSVEHLRELRETEWGTTGAYVQMEIHPWYWRDALEIQTMFAEHALKMVGYALLAEGKLLANDCPAIVTDIAARRSMTRVGVVLAWALNKGWGVLVKSEDPDHLRQNLQAPLEAGLLRPEDCTAIDELSANGEEKLCWDPRLVK